MVNGVLTQSTPTGSVMYLDMPLFTTPNETSALPQNTLTLPIAFDDGDPTPRKALLSPMTPNSVTEEKRPFSVPHTESIALQAGLSFDLSAVAPTVVTEKPIATQHNITHNTPPLVKGISPDLPITAALDTVPTLPQKTPHAPVTSEDCNLTPNKTFISPMTPCAATKEKYPCATPTAEPIAVQAVAPLDLSVIAPTMAKVEPETVTLPQTLCTLTEQLSERILTAKASHTSEEEIRLWLKPQVLGQTEVRLKITQGSLSVHIHTAEPHIGALLLEHRTQLEARLGTTTALPHVTVSVTQPRRTRSTPERNAHDHGTRLNGKRIDITRALPGNAP